MKNSYISFDIFDTCVARLYQHPTDLFLHIGLFISPHTHTEKEKLQFSIRFRDSRILAEQLASEKKKGRGNITIDEIYTSFSNISEFGDPELIKNIEIKFEFRCTYPIRKVTKKIDEYREDGHKCIFISDTYLHSEHIIKKLQELKIFKPNDSIYISSQLGKTKHYGDLYDYACASEKISQHTLTHHGHNNHSDIKVARRKGINTIHINESMPKKYEILFKDMKPSAYSSIINSIPKQLRLDTLNKLTEVEHFYFSAAAPCLISFTAWSLIEAKKLGAKKVFFSARDMELPMEIAKTISKKIGLSINYLRSSRLSLLLPSIDFVDDRWIDIVVPSSEKSSIRKCLQRLQFNNEDIDKIAKTQEFSHLDFNASFHKHEIHDTIKDIVLHKNIKKTLDEKINLQLKNCLGYLEQFKINEENHFFIVDSGWALNTQFCINKILKKSDINKCVHGIYFGVSPKTLPTEECGNYSAFSEKDYFYFHRAATIEHILFTSCENSVLNYEFTNGKFIPTFMKNSPSNADLDFFSKLKEYTLSYLAIIEKMDIPISFFSEKKSEILQNYRNIIDNPPKDLIERLNQIDINIDAIHSEENKLKHVEKISAIDLLKIFAGVIFKKYKKRYFWPEASAAISNPIVKWLMRASLKIKHHKLNRQTNTTIK